MSLNSDMDLALLTDSDIRDLAKKADIPEWDSTGRPDLIVALRNNGIGKPHCLDLVTEFTDMIKSLKEEIANLRKRKEPDAIAEIKSELASLRNEIRSNNVVPAQHATPQWPSMHQSLNSVQIASSSTTSACTNAPQDSNQARTVPIKESPPTPRTTTSTTGTRRSTEVKHNRRIETSRYLSPKTPQSDQTSTLTGRPRVRVVYVGNFDPAHDASVIADHCKAEGVHIVQAVVFSAPHFHTAYARVTCLQEDEPKLLEEEFWPSNIGFTVRPWRFREDAPKGTLGNR